MAKYEFTNASGNRLIEKCLEFNKDMGAGRVYFERVEQWLLDEDYRSEDAFRRFVEWLRDSSQSSSSAAKVLGLVATGMADEMIRDREFIEKVEKFHTAMERRFGVAESNILKEGE